MTSPYNEKVNKLNTALENVYLKKADFIDELEDTLDGIDSEYQKQNIGVGYANKNVVTDSNGVITTEDKPTIPSASSTRPSADTTSGESGSSSDFARADHTHPKSSLYASSSHNHTTLGSVTQINASSANIPFLSVNGTDIYSYDQRLFYNRTNNNIQYSKNNTFSELATMNDLPVNLSDLNDDLGVITSHNPIDSELSSTSTNAVQNKVIQVALNGKANTIHNHRNIPTKTSDLLNDGDGVNNFITQSSINGLVKNDGTIDTNTYLTTHQDITGKVNISDIQDNLTSTDSDKPLSAKQGKILNEAIGSKTISIEKQSTAENGFTATYVIKQNGTALSPKINIPKDFLLKSASLETVGNTPTTIETENNLSSGDKYLKFIVNTQENDNITTLLIPVNDLIDTYTGDNSTIVLNNNNTFSVKNNVFADKNHTHTSLIETEIPSNSDLDSYITEGIYYYKREQSNAITNIPSINAPFTLIVFYTIFNDSKVIIQQLIDGNANIYTRRRTYNGNWSDWVSLISSNKIIDNLTTDSATQVLSAKQGKWLKDNTASASHDHDHISGGVSGFPIFNDTDGVGMYALGDKIIYDWSDSNLVYYDKNGNWIDEDNEIATKGDISDAIGDAITYINQ